MQKQEIKTKKDAIVFIIDSMNIGQQFYGYELQRKVAEIIPSTKNCYVDTILRMAREHCREKFKAVNPRKSLYERV